MCAVFDYTEKYQYAHVPPMYNNNNNGVKATGLYTT